ncbi:MAG TPA: anhydro-N-acetylmuramic acid kinase [Salinimicrobium sp.]|nr:anhydro-N-acetylmuramic acid kinase [Salinimicrobium sp.]
MKKNQYLVLGIMSGTSLDGIDIALCSFEASPDWKYNIIHAETIAYPKEWKKRLSEAVFFDKDRLAELNRDYTGFLAKIISDYLERQKPSDLDAICSHGHTIRHEPGNGYTLQIGNLPQLAQLTGYKVICDFRVQDVELGGQGAPLVPIGDQLLFSKYQACLNLGGFANISLGRDDNRLAFDICAVNTVLNYLAGIMGLEYDKGGLIAESGELDKNLLKKLDQLEFYRREPPKSLGIEWVNEKILPLFEGAEDIPALLHTYSVHAAGQIVKILEEQSISKVLVTGGGSFNKFLIEKIRKSSTAVVVIPAPEVINYKEALIFGLLGVLRLRGEINVLSSVTGAVRDHSSGEIFFP